MRNKQKHIQVWWEEKDFDKKKNTMLWDKTVWQVQNMQTQDNIIDVLDQDNIIKEINTLISVLENKQEVLALMKQSIESGLLDIYDAKAYREIEGKKLESKLFNEIKNRYGTAQAMLTWLQVRTKGFKDWFGDWQKNPGDASKVIDIQGEPIVMFRGDDKNKAYFEKRENRANKYGNWIYLTKNYATALSIAQTWYKNPIVFLFSLNHYISNHIPKVH